MVMNYGHYAFFNNGKNIMKFKKISIIGLGYVGLPLAYNLSKYFNVVGFDINKKRIKELNIYKDSNLDLTKIELKKNNFLKTFNLEDLKNSDVFIITVPTPINKNKKPDIQPLKEACQIVGKFISKKNLVIFESTVYPGLTEELCKPILEKISGLKSPRDFGIGYSPERVNPGDKKHTLIKISKIVSGQNKKICDIVFYIYKKIIKAKIFKASSIKIAESAKVIENIQRDLNIAFVNELSIIFNNLNLKTREIINLASTKWNFMKFEPGLVGGHCISVDPYYLTYKSTLSGYKPKFILSGRSINDQMPEYIVKILLNKIKKKNIKTINFFGITFKENCPDFRNSLSIRLIQKLKKKFRVDVHDPYHESKNLMNGIKVNSFEKIKKRNVNIISVNHKFYKKNKSYFIKKIFKKNCLILDLKGIFNEHEILKYKLKNIWQL